jgi:hypothetical protein
MEWMKRINHIQDEILRALVESEELSPRFFPILGAEYADSPIENPFAFKSETQYQIEDCLDSMELQMMGIKP